MKGLIVEKKKRNIYENYIVSFLFFLIVFGVLIGCGTLWSGFHFVDDGDYIEFYIKKVMEKKDYLQILIETLQWDMSEHHRFRPLYYMIRVALGITFELNLFAISIIRGLEIVVSMFVIYLVAQKLHLTKIVSVLVTLFITVGPQSAVWWKLGPQEAAGMWMLPLIIYFLLVYYETEKKIYNFTALIICFLSCCYKETYIAFLPAVGIAYLLLEQKKNGVKGEHLRFKHLVIFIKSRWGSIVYLFTLFISICYLWLFKMQGNHLSYAKVTTEVTLYDYLVVQFNNLRMPLRVGSYALFAFIVVICFWKYKKELINYKLEVILGLYIILSQMVIYLRTGLEERYVYPWILGVCWLFVILVIKVNKMVGRTKKIFYISLCCLLLYNGCLVVKEAMYFAHRGQSITKLWQEVEKISDRETVILTAFEPYYESDETNYLWFKAKGLENVYHVNQGEIYHVKDEKPPVSFEEVDIILLYDQSDRHYIEEPKLDLSNYTVKQYGTVRMAVRNNEKFIE